jgi:hypothetical protein
MSLHNGAKWGLIQEEAPAFSVAQAATLDNAPLQEVEVGPLQHQLVMEVVGKQYSKVGALEQELEVRLSHRGMT